MTTDDKLRPPLTPEERIERGYATIHALCSGKLRWEMRVPAEPDHDPDLILVDALSAARELLDAERAGAGRLREALAAEVRDRTALLDKRSADLRMALEKADEFLMHGSLFNDHAAPDPIAAHIAIRAALDAEPGQPS